MSENHDPKVAAKAFFREGKNLKESFMEAGYSNAQARKGKALLVQNGKLADAFKRERLKQVHKFAALGMAITAQEQESFVRGSLIDETVKSDSRQRVRAAELLGKDKRVAMWEPDVNINIGAFNMPETWWDCARVKNEFLAADLETFSPHTLGQVRDHVMDCTDCRSLTEGKLP